MLPEEAKAIAEYQRRRFNELVDVFDRPQPPAVMARLWEIVASAALRPGAVVLDVGTGAGVLIPLIQSYQPSIVLACDVAEKMLQRVQHKYPGVRPYHTDIISLALEHFHGYCRPYPQCENHAKAFSAVMAARASLIAFCKASTVRALAERSNCLIFDQACSMGLKSGE